MLSVKDERGQKGIEAQLCSGSQILHDLKTACCFCHFLFYLFIFFPNRYSPVLIQALCQQCHLHRDGRGRIPMHLSPRLRWRKLQPEDRTLPYKWVLVHFSLELLDTIYLYNSSLLIIRTSNQYIFYLMLAGRDSGSRRECIKHGEKKDTTFTSPFC